MPDVPTLSPPTAAARLNVADRLAAIARRMPDVTAVVCPRKWSPAYRVTKGSSDAAYATTTFGELDADASRIAGGLAAWGVPHGTRLALLVRPGIDFVALVFGLLRAGMVIELIDPGIGQRKIIRCLADANPEGFIAISMAQAARLCLRHKFPHARWNVTVGRRWFWGGTTLERIRSLRTPHSTLPTTSPDSPAAIIFTSGSTGPPKGVLYTQRMFDTQVSEIQSTYGIEPGGIDLACFPLFALFNSAMGVTTVLPEMDFSRPAATDPKKLLAAANDWRVTQAFASPAVWRVVSNHCAKTGERIPSLRQVFSCGAPVPTDVLRAMLACVGLGAKMHTPYGATECLPVATIEAAKVLRETAARTDAGAGVCVGRKFDSIEWRVIAITDKPIATIDLAQELPVGEIGELIVRGPQVSPEYVTRVEANPLAKIDGGASGECGVRSAELNSPSPLPTPHSTLNTWHRTGDVGYLDDAGRLWYCGRKSHRVETLAGPLYTECVEAVFNTHPAVRRSALVGVGKLGAQQPVLVVERRDTATGDAWRDDLLRFAQQHAATRSIQQVLAYPALPVDIRHNAKINREALTIWATHQLSGSPSAPRPLTPDP